MCQLCRWHTHVCDSTHIGTGTLWYVTPCASLITYYSIPKHKSNSPCDTLRTGTRWLDFLRFYARRIVTGYYYFYFMAGGVTTVVQGATLLLPSSFVILIIATLSIKTTHLVPLFKLSHALLTFAFLYPIMKVEPFFKKNIWQGRWRRLFSRATLLPSLLVTHIIATPARKSTILVPLLKLSHWLWHSLEIWAIIGHTQTQVLKWN